MKKFEIPVRIIVVQPPAGVTMKVQKGRDELLTPLVTKQGLTFDLTLEVDLTSGRPNFLGKFAQGPKDARFIYVNSGSYAGQSDTCWSRRAKISLMKITAEQVKGVLASPGSRLEVSFLGTGTDGGPVCASVRSAADSWMVVQK